MLRKFSFLAPLSHSQCAKIKLCICTFYMCFVYLVFVYSVCPLCTLYIFYMYFIYFVFLSYEIPEEMPEKQNLVVQLCLWISSTYLLENWSSTSLVVGWLVGLQIWKVILISTEIDVVVWLELGNKDNIKQTRKTSRRQPSEKRWPPN